MSDSLEVLGNFLDAGKEFEEAFSLSVSNAQVVERQGDCDTYRDSMTPIDVRWVISSERAVGRYSHGSGSSAKPWATRRRIIRSIEIVGLSQNTCYRYVDLKRILTNQQRIRGLQGRELVQWHGRCGFRQRWEHIQVMGHFNGHNDCWLIKLT